MCTSFSCCLAPEQYSSFLNLPRSKGELTVLSILTLANTDSHEVSSKSLSNNSTFDTMSIYGRGYAHKEDGVLSFTSCWINELHWALNSTNPNHGVYTLRVSFSSVQFSHSVVSNSLRPHGLQHARPSCPSPTPGVYSNSCQLSRWCHPTISSSVVPFSSHL